MDNQHYPSIPTDTEGLRALPLLLDIETARQMPNVSGRYMRTLCEEGKVKAVKMGKVWRVNRDSLIAFCGLD